jgi:hypothetical protein
MNLTEFFSKPIVIFAVHTILMLGLFVNIFQLYRLDKIQKEVSTMEFNLDTLRQEKESSAGKKDYYNSEIFKEKYAKEENFKKRGEEVIDTSLVEGENTENNSYVPVDLESGKSNPILWWEFLFSSDQ